MKSTPSLASLALALAGLVPACLPSVDGGQAPECRATTDCPVSGQVCEDSVCWGAPPPGHFAAVLSPPASPQLSLAVTELPELAIPEDGGFGKLVIQAPVHISGRVHLNCQAPALIGCDSSASVAATVTIVRDSSITGGPQYVDSTASEPGVTGDSFTLAAPRLSLAHPTDTLIITPSDTMPITPGGPTPAQLAPPLTTTVDATDDHAHLDFVLGLGQLRTVTGRIVDATGTGVSGVRVTAMGRFTDKKAPLQRVSTVAISDINGYYAIYVTPSASSIVDIVGTLPDPGVTLRLRDISAAQATQSVPDLATPAAGTAITVTFPVLGLNGAGQMVPVPGAVVHASVDLEDKLRPAQANTYDVEATTKADGTVKLDLIPGSGSDLRPYQFRIIPPPGSEFASLYKREIDIGTKGGVLAEIDLPHRVAISGSLLDANGNPAAGVTINAEPAASVVLGLTLDATTALASVQPPSTTTTADGSYFLWVDPDLAGAAPTYDLECVPPDGTSLPRWIFRDVSVALSDASITYNMGARQLPPGRHVRGTVVDQNSKPVEGAEVRLYEVLVDPTLCKVANMPADCILPAALRAVDRSDDDGDVRLVLPAPAS